MESTLRGPRYLAAQITAERIYPRFGEMQHKGETPPTIDEMERLIDAAFWASLRREESYSPQISLAFLPRQHAGESLTLEHSLGLTPEALARLAPAAERPGIHLGVWRDGEEGDLRVWGATRAIPAFCFVLEVIAPGLLVVKYRHADATAKFVNVAVLEGDAVKVLDPSASSVPGCPNLVSALLGFDSRGPSQTSNPLVELAVSMRSHKRGGTLLVVPAESEAWRESIRHPITYSVSPKFARLADLMAEPPAVHHERRWQDSFHRTVEAIAGLTAVDGATMITDRYEVLAFGAKIQRREGSASVENVILSEPVEGFKPHVLPALQTGGTRHLSAAQFAHDQQDSMAMVASQDGRFTIFAWSDCDSMVRAHRVETLLM
jgi:hypothetical protein